MASKRSQRTTKEIVHYQELLRRDDLGPVYERNLLTQCIGLMEARERSGKPFVDGPYALDGLRERLREAEPKAAAVEAVEEAARQAREDDIVLHWLYEMENADRYDERIGAAECVIMEMEKLSVEELTKYPYTLDEVRAVLKEEKMEYGAWRASPEGQEMRRKARERAEARGEREEHEALVSGRSDDDDEEDEEEW